MSVVLKTQSFSPPEDKRNGRAVLVIHGWSGSPETMTPLSRALQEAGYFVLAPLLTGHGCDNPDSFAAAKMEDWLKDVDGQYRLLVDHFQYAPKNIDVVGLSMGALLAIHLVRTKGISRAVLMAPAIENRDWNIHFSGFLGIFVPYWRNKVAPPVEVSKGVVADGLDDMIYKRYTWVRPAYQLLRMQKYAKKITKSDHGWTYPIADNRQILIQWANNDEAVPFKGPNVVNTNLRENIKHIDHLEFQSYDQGRHELTLFSQKAVDEAVAFFVQRPL